MDPKKLKELQTDELMKLHPELDRTICETILSLTPEQVDKYIGKMEKLDHQSSCLGGTLKTVKIEDPTKEE